MAETSSFSGNSEGGDGTKMGSFGRGNIHQTVEWGRFQAQGKQRDKFWCVAVLDGAKIVAGAMMIKQKLPKGMCWLYMPRGPLWTEEKQLELILAKVKELAVKEKAVFLRVDPAVVESFQDENGLRKSSLQDELKQLKKAGFRHAHAHYQPETTLMVDLGQTEGQILAQMKPKGRYNIKLAEKKGVKILEGGKGIDLAEGVAKFYGLLEETTSRDGFSGHDEKYYLKMLEELGVERCKLYLAEYEGEIIAGMIVTFFGEMAIYYFGASGNKHRNVMAPYLLQWNAMREAKSRGIKWYDFLGIAPVNEAGEVDEKHAWAGVTEFKKKFGGVVVNYQPAQELVYNWPVYWAMRGAKWAKGLLRKKV